MTAPIGDPASGSALSAAVEWVAGVLLGQTATAMAIVATASLGFLMLTGRLPVRRGASVVIGCFILFSAGGVASGLLGATRGTAGERPAAVAAAAPAYTPATPKAQPYDPYSGAAVPDQKGGDLLD